ncbi:hypothetical protein [Streptomyces sp. NPDC059916]|uniref:hypothetical protein n=1 Tax=Streptomyces sp. NPDC059916 TaxID=3347001 RepID=UPI0036C90394
MSIQTIAPIGTDEPGENAYNDGYLDGELDAMTKLPAHLVMDRASMADAYDPLWAQGYADGYLDTIARNAALQEREEAQIGDLA